MISTGLAIFIGGGLGAVLRFAISQLCKNAFGLALWGTLCVNLIGCFAMGYLYGLTLLKANALPHLLRVFLTVGFLGGLTTFSTFQLEIFETLKSGKIGFALFYLILSGLLGLLLTTLGYILSKA